MRLTVVFIALLVIAATSVSYVWRGLFAFDDGGTLYQFSVLLGLVAAIVSGGLLTRIVVKTSAVHQRLKGR